MPNPWSAHFTQDVRHKISWCGDFPWHLIRSYLLHVNSIFSFQVMFVRCSFELLFINLNSQVKVLYPTVQSKFQFCHIEIPRWNSSLKNSLKKFLVEFLVEIPHWNSLLKFLVEIPRWNSSLKFFVEFLIEIVGNLRHSGPENSCKSTSILFDFLLTHSELIQ